MPEETYRKKAGVDLVVVTEDGVTITDVHTNAAKTRARITDSGPVTPPPPPPPPGDSSLPYLSRAYVGTLPRTGSAFTAVQAAAKGPRPDLSDQNSAGSAAMLARGFLGDVEGVRADLAACIATAPKVARVLSLGRESQPIALAAVLTGLDPRPAIKAVLELTGLEDRGVGDGTIRTHARKDPTNWGCHSRATIAWFAFAGAVPEEEAAENVRRYLTTGEGFTYKSDQQSWQPTAGKLVCIGPKSSDLQVDGVITNDAYRGGPPPDLKGDGANYVWEGFQGTVSAAIALDMIGYSDVWSWGDRAILRAGQWMYRKGVPASGDDRWIGWVLRKVYGGSWPYTLATPTSPGKGWGFTDWTYPS